ncbi:MAG: hypothetical protein WA081_08925 [Desulfosalsimonadaceae bacterium]
MSLFESISKKSCFTVAVGISMFLWAGVAAFFGILLDYIVMADQQMGLFITIVSIIGIMAAICMTIQILLLGLVRSLCLKPLRPINENIIGVDLSPNISMAKLNQTITSLKKFPVINGILGFFLCSVIIVVLITTVYLKGYEFFWVMTQVIFGSLAVLIYGVATFLFTSAKVAPVRKQAYYLLSEYKKDDRNQKD